MQGVPKISEALIREHGQLYKRASSVDGLPYRIWCCWPNGASKCTRCFQI